MVHEIVERKHLWQFHLDVADSRVPTQRDRDKIQPASVPCQPKLAESLRDSEGALHDEILQGRARFALLRCLAAATVDSSVLVEAGVGVWEHDDMLATRRSGKDLCGGAPPEPNLFLTIVRRGPVRGDKQSPSRGTWGSRSRSSRLWR